MKVCVTCEEKKREDQYYKGRNTCKKCIKEYNQQPHVRDRQAEARLRWVNKNPIKVNARVLINKAIKDGTLIKENCEVCGTDEKIEGHHDDYSKPLEVRWLCTQHHNDWHVEHGEGLNGNPSEGAT